MLLFRAEKLAAAVKFHGQRDLLRFTAFLTRRLAQVPAAPPPRGGGGGEGGGGGRGERVA